MYLNCEERYEDVNDHSSYLLSSYVLSSIKAWKNQAWTWL